MKSLMPLLLSTAFCFKSSVKKEIAGIFNKYFCLISPRYEPLVHIGIGSIHIELFFFSILSWNSITTVEVILTNQKQLCPVVVILTNKRQLCQVHCSGYYNQSETITAQYIVVVILPNQK